MKKNIVSVIVLLRLYIPAPLFQFDDDLAITTSTEKDNQLFLNVFNKWCNWPCLIIYVDKC